MKRALTIGINDYPNAPLQGCVNDATQWALYFSETRRFDRVNTIIGRDATRARVTAAIRAMLEVSVAGDEIAIQYSGHGTRVPDQSGDEKDQLDEAWVLYDGVWLDDEIADLLKDLPSGVKMVVVSDSCHSGTVSRAEAAKTGRRMKCIACALAPRGGSPDRVRRMFSQVVKEDRRDESAMNHLLLAGAAPTEYAWDSSFKGQPWGAMSFHALSILRSPAARSMSWDQFIIALSKRLPSEDSPQHPQLEGPLSLRRTYVNSR